MEQSISKVKYQKKQKNNIIYLRSIVHKKVDIEDELEIE